MIVLDTSALVHWLTTPERLTPAARRAIQSPGPRAISSMSIWEIALKVRRGRLELPSTVEELVSRLERLEDFEVISVDVETWLASVNLEWNHADPADRVIVALATALDCPLVSSDGTMAEYYNRTVW